MGIMDVFNPEDRVEVTKRELLDFMLGKAKTELLINGLKNGVSNENMLKVLDVKVSREAVEDGGDR